jgi:hypothetical protein
MTFRVTKTNRITQTVWLALQVFSILLILSTAAGVSAATRCEVLTIHASNEGKGSDARLSQYSAIFKSKPFSAFDSFALIDKQIVAVELKTPKTLRFPDKIDGSLQLNGVSTGNFDLTLVLSRLGKPPIRINGVAAPQSPIFAAGMKSASGIWVFGVVCDHSAGGIAY